MSISARFPAQPWRSSVANRSWITPLFSMFFVLGVVTTTATAQQGVCTQLSQTNFAAEPLRIQSASASTDNLWLYTLRLRVKNTSLKPIYSFSYCITFPTTGGGGNSPVGVILRYGPRMGLTDLKATGQPALDPGKSVEVGINADDYRGYAHYVNSQNFGSVTQADVTLQEVNYGDGTGYIGGATYSRSQPTIVHGITSNCYSFDAHYTWTDCHSCNTIVTAEITGSGSSQIATVACEGYDPEVGHIECYVQRVVGCFSVGTVEINPQQN